MNQIDRLNEQKSKNTDESQPSDITTSSQNATKSNSDCFDSVIKNKEECTSMKNRVDIDKSEVIKENQGGTQQQKLQKKAVKKKIKCPSLVSENNENEGREICRKERKCNNSNGRVDNHSNVVSTLSSKFHKPTEESKTLACILDGMSKVEAGNEKTTSLLEKIYQQTEENKTGILTTILDKISKIEAGHESILSVTEKNATNSQKPPVENDCETRKKSTEYVNRVMYGTMTKLCGLLEPNLVLEPQKRVQFSGKTEELKPGQRSTSDNRAAAMKTDKLDPCPGVKFQRATEKPNVHNKSVQCSIEDFEKCAKTTTRTSSEENVKTDSDLNSNCGKYRFFSVTDTPRIDCHQVRRELSVKADKTMCAPNGTRYTSNPSNRCRIINSNT